MAEQESGGGDDRSFWKTLPGILTGVAALLTATAAVAGLFIASDSGNGDGENGDGTTATITQPGRTNGGGGSSGGGGGGTTGGNGNRPGPEGFRVVGTTMRVDPFEGTVSCPVEITFSGRIDVAGGGGTVSYRWVRSDGAEGSVETVEFDGPGSRDVTTTWTRGAPGEFMEGWQSIDIVEPEGPDSGRAEFRLTCE